MVNPHRGFLFFEILKFDVIDKYETWTKLAAKNYAHVEIYLKEIEALLTKLLTAD